MLILLLNWIIDKDSGMNSAGDRSITICVTTMMGIGSYGWELGLDR